MLKDKIVVIYGAGGDIGAGVARAFAREGANGLRQVRDAVGGSNLVMSDDPVAADFNPNRAYLASLAAAGLVAGNVRVLRTLARLLCCCCAVLAALAQPQSRFRERPKKS
jgi:NAD(P)-dependent dehydrogenase (short-subunit alcohol dehydrogenase family)